MNNAEPTNLRQLTSVIFSVISPVRTALENSQQLAPPVAVPKLNPTH
jgi:hypothetical protein